ncbi:MAG: hypothetical protein AAGE18_15640 [Pseudomonadota bacterium]
MAVYRRPWDRAKLGRCLAGGLCVGAALGLAACTDGGRIGPTLGGYGDLPVSEIAQATPYPELISVPTTLPAGSYGPGVPDPVRGAVVTSDLSAEVERLRVLGEALSRPVIAPARRAELLAAVAARE